MDMTVKRNIFPSDAQNVSEASICKYMELMDAGLGLTPSLRNKYTVRARNSYFI